MASPLDIFLDLVFGIFVQTYDSMIFAATKFFELFAALSSLTGGGAFGILLTSLILGIIGFFILRFVLHSAFYLILLFIVLYMVILGLGYFASL